ncbi:siderophore-interacting protein [Aldersonia kunmingensis]|uniref:siderophore-interacting protein n=1 Tax=Aldersonia kunmingensis TaxID=408066 RepID=UPI00082F3E21|nr:siderophore-interacting protein [Aldersonia kunmingensis]
MAKRSKYVKPEEPTLLRAHVLASKQVSPNFVRVTVGGEELSSFTAMGFDQWFRLFVKKPGQAELRLPTQTSLLWYAQYLMMGAEKPLCRNFTVREYRSAEAALHGAGPEIDIDFVSHGDASPASAWANSVSPGDELGMLDEGLIYNPEPAADWQLFVGDESALPAILGILRSADRGLRGEAFIEIPHADDAQEVDAPEGVNLHWLVRTDSHARAGKLALDAVTAATLPTGRGYAFLAGEKDLATGLRRLLVNERGFAKEDISFTGFWRFGKAQG